MEIFTTQDGSHSLILENEGVFYRSKYGAVMESKHVFIEAGLFYKSIEKKSIKILEVGFGSGLNAYLSLLAAKKFDFYIHYTTIELRPIPIEISKHLNYPQILGAKEDDEEFLRLHLSEWDEVVRFNEHFDLKKINDNICNIRFDERYDLIFYDLFAPSFDSKLWERPIFEKLFDALDTSGVIVTYCAKGEFKRTLKSIGFYVESLQGPPGRREMTRAIKKS